MNTYTEKERAIPVYGTFDTVVVGGGFTGVGAAMAAAREGADTLIIERFACFGGSGTLALMNNINGFRNQVKPDHIQTSKGIAEEVILNLKEIDGLGKAAYRQEEYGAEPGKLSFGYAVDSEKLKYILLKMVVDAGAKILFHTMLSDAIMDGDTLKGIVVETKGGRYAIYAKNFVDASGDADLAFHAGVPFWQTKHDEEKRLGDGMMYKVIGYDPENRTYNEGTEANGGVEAGGAVTLWGPRAGGINSLDPDERTQAEIKTRLAVYEDLEEKKAKLPWLKDARIVETPQQLGIRQTRFIEGVYKITLDDVLEGRQFDDAIAMGSKPIIMYFGYRRFLEHPGYEIPYRCMLPKKVENLLVAGRCMSSDQPAFESWRSMAPVMCLGQAAGTACALSVKAGVTPRQLPIDQLQKVLKANNAEIGGPLERRK
ncbi:MAG: FAD-dependent oxidoreductase [Oscillospiraceae bacterium]|jgi:NADPH-dependent 2,4-dienoyl-CoA reductase/sulfur reductase-like enzyme|nr:FAD-dependent oxidoreductase [Oscillospiraceae bacterium]